MVKRFLLPVVVCGLLVAATTSLAFMGSAFFMAGKPPTGGGGGNVCGQGTPNFTGTENATAVAAGLTTCVNNSDFSTTFMGSTANWLDCAMSSGTPVWYNSVPEAGNRAPCSDYSIIADPLNSSIQVLHQTYTCCGTGTDWANGVPDSHLASTKDDSASPGVLYPELGIFLSIKLRLSSATVSSSCHTGGTSPNCGLIDSYLWGTAGASYAFCEEDLDESYSLGYFDISTSHLWNGQAACPGNPSGTFNDFVDLTQYHAIDFLLTNDGTSQIAACTWIDGTLKGCSTATTTAGQVSARVVSYFTIMGKEFGIGCDVGTSNCTTFPITGTRDAYIQYYRLFSCSSWATGGCGGSIQFNSGGLIYWHN